MTEDPERYRIRIAKATPHWAASFDPDNPWGMPQGWMPLPYGVLTTDYEKLQAKLRKRFPGCSIEPATEEVPS
jgi:hypothetical protein